jgi:hypothetical protein
MSFSRHATTPLAVALLLLALSAAPVAQAGQAIAVYGVFGLGVEVTWRAAEEGRWPAGRRAGSDGGWEKKRGGMWACSGGAGDALCCCRARATRNLSRPLLFHARKNTAAQANALPPPFLPPLSIPHPPRTPNHSKNNTTKTQTGNWCGPNYGSGVPVDAIDAACQRHDYCYDAAVANSGGNKWAENAAKCACDNTLMAEANGIKAGAAFSSFSEWAQTTVEGILKVFSVKCSAVAVYDTVKEMWAAAKAAKAANNAAAQQG